MYYRTAIGRKLKTKKTTKSTLNFDKILKTAIKDIKNVSPVIITEFIHNQRFLPILDQLFQLSFLRLMHIKKIVIMQL